VYPFKTVIRSLVHSCWCGERRRSSAASSGIRQGEWPVLREASVQEVDVEKLKEMVHVKDEDIAKLDKFVVQQERHNEAAHRNSISAFR